jgi:hypothetical protein
MGYGYGELGFTSRYEEGLGDGSGFGDGFGDGAGD